MNLRILFVFLIMEAGSCNKIKTGNAIDTETKNVIKSLGLLEKGETIIKFYSNYQEKLAGNFYTNKRIAHYWLDENQKEESDTTFAFYQDIVSIDTIFKVPDTFSPYLLIKKKDSSEFKVYVDGNHQLMIDFYIGALQNWRNNKSH